MQTTRSAEGSKTRKQRRKKKVLKSTSTVEQRTRAKKDSQGWLKLKRGQSWLTTVAVVNKSMFIAKKRENLTDGEDKGEHPETIVEGSNGETEQDKQLVKVRDVAKSTPLKLHNLDGDKKRKVSSLDVITSKEEKARREEKLKEKGKSKTSLFYSLALSPRLPGTKFRSSKEDKEEEKEKERERKERKEKEEREKKEKKEREEREKRERKEKEEREKKEKKEREEREKEKEKEKEKEGKSGGSMRGEKYRSSKEDLTPHEREVDFVAAKLKKHPVFHYVDPNVAATVEGMMQEYFTPQKLRKINGGYCIKAKLQFVAMSMFSFKKLKYAPSIVLGTISEAVSEFGLVHAAVQIGPYRLDWNRAEISLPKEIRCESEPLLLLDLKGGDLYIGDDYEKVAEICRKVCEISVRWNRTKHYSLGSHCQHFVNEVLEVLNLQMDFEEPIAGYLRKLRKHGTVPMQFLDPFTKKKVKFKRHAHIDRYANNLLLRHPNFAQEYPNHWLFLKAFDRAFWACQMSYDSSDDETDSSTDEESTFDEESSEGSESGGGGGSSRRNNRHPEDAFWNCPFGNPMDLLFGSFSGGVLETALKSEDETLKKLMEKKGDSGIKKQELIRRFTGDESDTGEVSQYIEEARVKRRELAASRESSSNGESSSESEKEKEKEKEKERVEEDDVHSNHPGNGEIQQEGEGDEDDAEHELKWRLLREKLHQDNLEHLRSTVKGQKRSKSLPRHTASTPQHQEMRSRLNIIQSYRTPSVNKKEKSPTLEELKKELLPITISARRKEFKREETRMKVAEVRKKVRQKMEELEARTMEKEDINVLLLPPPPSTPLQDNNNNSNSNNKQQHTESDSEELQFLTEMEEEPAPGGSPRGVDVGGVLLN